MFHYSSLGLLHESFGIISLQYFEPRVLAWHASGAVTCTVNGTKVLGALVLMEPSWSTKGDEVATHSSTRVCWVRRPQPQIRLLRFLLFTKQLLKQRVRQSNQPIIRAHIKPEINTSADYIKGRLWRAFSESPWSDPSIYEWAAELTAWPALKEKSFRHCCSI